MTVIALDVGGTQIKAGVVAEDGSLVHSERWFTRADRGPDAVLDTVLTCAADLAGRYAPRAAGIAVPGIVDEASGTSVFAANLGWRRVPVRDWLAEALGLPVAFGHDVRAGGLAEARLGAGRGCRSFLFVPVGTGIASAIVLDGKALTGSHGYAGELGHLTVRPAGEPCPCGSRGCLETVASASAIARRYRDVTGAADVGAKAVSAKDVRERAASGDVVAAEVWREAIDALADGLSAAITLLDPERIVIGGGLAGAGAAYFDPLRAALAERLSFQKAPRIVPAELGHQAGCLGAALLAQDLPPAGRPATPVRRRSPVPRQTRRGADG
ncbi:MULTISPECIES: ROK family protein [unclassified Kitasatospora]|uniref:ROK family protein n=1 Tax=unclassified Kitasatospora TaxID=2633591 RepID=UPI0033DBA909